ncbi:MULTISPECIES: universal stress protein [unclassified Luteococcus]|uniref:universal stress protein n=1 Tax=unclassified Luteococcus TaxID=2639923 RepID=UPI00313B898E
MSAVDYTGQIVVGVDGSGQSAVATEWAAQRAEQLGLGLTMVLATPPLQIPTSRGRMMRQSANHFGERIITAARERLDVAASEASAAHPELQITAQLLEDSEPALAMVQASSTAALTVVGTRGLGAIKAMALGSVSRHLITHGHGPIVVVPETGTARDERAVGTVAVGVDDASHSTATLHAAIEEAERLGGRLLAIHSWEYSPSVVEGMPAMDTELFETVQHTYEEDLAALVREQVGDHPSFDVEVRVTLGNAGEVLVNASHEAELLVVGSRGRSGLGGLLLGSTAAHVARASICPVLVIPAQKLLAHQ